MSESMPPIDDFLHLPHYVSERIYSRQIRGVWETWSPSQSRWVKSTPATVNRIAKEWATDDRDGDG